MKCGGAEGSREELNVTLGLPDVARKCDVLSAVAPQSWHLSFLRMSGAWDWEFMKSFWLVKQEPSSYSWSDFVAEGETSWTGVRNFAARNNLRKMRPGDEVLFYHSGDEKAVVGIAKVTRTAYPDPTAKEGDWSTVDLVPEDQGQLAAERNSVSSSIAFIGHASGRTRVSGNRKYDGG